MDKRFEQTLNQRRYMDGKQDMEKMLNSLVIRKMCIKTTVRYHYISVKVAKVKKTELWMVGEDVD